MVDSLQTARSQTTHWPASYLRFAQVIQLPIDLEAANLADPSETKSCSPDEFNFPKDTIGFSADPSK
ncbi:hypothetical protein DTL21_06520 [Bremerella cremea]|uniref:Uncharacterized protein n=1 Tax=Blastopirellula marina TaxID=124 RepID=A0A2S8FZH6_9BACT|nr:hypothetical protein C5Y83_06520 [Blastopirellula marina]RCS49982.1 hypothetical protein DTL21_06520 [Bremerella cremea]